MFFDPEFEVVFDPKDLAVGRKLLRKLDEFPPGIWTTVSDTVERIMRQRATKITRYGVSKSTQKWRRSMSNQGRSVPTYVGASGSVLNSPRVGKRTGTFVDDLRNSDEPTIETGVSSYQGDTGFSGVSVANGTFSYRINFDAYDKSYPLMFADYLQSRGIIPEGGLLDFEGAEGEYLLDLLINEVGKQVEEYFGSI